MLDEFSLPTEEDRKVEPPFILNTRHALRLVERFDACVPVGEHTDLAREAERAVEYARRYDALCPERLYLKVPFTPAGLLATRRLSDEGIPVNNTPGSSARRNYPIARIARPKFVNVFLGRLNSFVADNGLGDGRYVGERATPASHAGVRELRQDRDLPTRQIDLETLWQVEDRVVRCVEALAGERPGMFTDSRLLGFFERNGRADLLVKWSDGQRATSEIQKLQDWSNLRQFSPQASSA